MALAYLTLRGSEARLAIAQTNLASQEETLQITRWRVQAGLATSLESEQARASVEQIRAQIPALQTGIAQSRHQLALLTGRTVAQLSLAGGTALPLPPADLALSFPAETLRQRPDVRAAELKVSAAAQRVLQADAARYPSFNLSGSLGLSALTLSGLTGGGALASSLLASVSVPVFDGGAAKAQVQAQQAALDQARAAHRGAVLTALKDVEDALVALQGDRERLANLRNAAEAADNAALLARQRYASGLVDFQTVLETQRSQLSAQDSVASGSTELAADHVRLYKALGGGWLPDAPPNRQDGITLMSDTQTPCKAPRRSTSRRCSTNPRRARRGSVRCSGPALALLAAALAGGWAWQARKTAAAAPSYVTEPVTRGQLSVVVSANGTLQPTHSVNIGSELSGTVSRVNVDVNDRVKKGQVLVELDTAKLRDQIVRSRAAVASADAKVLQAVATVKEAQGNLARLEEVSRLSGGKVPAQSELETARATLDRARADEASARANVADARAALSTDETNLSKASIRSPMDGVVLTRTVDPGNAVAASLQAVTLFSIAEDLAQLRLQVNVDETDVGTVKNGQKASSPSAPTRTGATRPR